MPFLPPEKRVMQPQQAVRLDRANSLIIGLQSAIDHNGVDVVRNILPESITAPRIAGKAGFGLTFADGAEVAKCAPFLPAITNFTTVTLIIPNFSSASNARAGIYDYQASAGSAQDRLRLIWLDSGNGFYIDTNGGFAASCKPAFSAGDLLSVAFTRTSGSGQQFYINGSAVSTTNVAVSNAGGPAAAVPTWLGDDVEAASGWRFNGQILLHLYFSRVLSATEIKSLSINPWQIFAADDVSLFFDYVSIGGTDGSASGDISGVTISSPAGSAAGDALASSGLSSVSLSSPTAAASGGALAATSPASVTLTAPTGTASATAGGDATATASIQSITLSYPTGTASGTATASASVAAVSIIAPTGSASVASGDATAEGEIQAVTLTAPTGYVPQETSRAGGDDRPRGIYWQNQPKRKIKRSKLDQILDTMGVEDVAEDFQEFVEEHAEENPIKQAIRKHVTPSNEIKWPSLENDIAALKKLLAEYEQYLIDQDDDDILPFLMELI